MTAFEAFGSLDTVKCFADIHGDKQMNVMLSEWIGKVETLKLQNINYFLRNEVCAITIKVKYSEIFVKDIFLFEKVQVKRTPPWTPF